MVKEILVGMPCKEKRIETWLWSEGSVHWNILCPNDMSQWDAGFFV